MPVVNREWDGLHAHLELLEKIYQSRTVRFLLLTAFLPHVA